MLFSICIILVSVSLYVLMFRIVEVSGKTSKLIEDLASTTNMQSESEHSLNSVSKDLDCTGKFRCNDKILCVF